MLWSLEPGVWNERGRTRGEVMAPDRIIETYDLTEVSRLTLAALLAAVDEGAPPEVVDPLLDAMRRISELQSAN